MSTNPAPNVGDQKPDRLQDLFKELMAEVRWRRDQEARFLTLFLSSFSIIAGGLFVFLTKVDGAAERKPVLIFTVCATLLLTFFTWVKICTDHFRQRVAARAVVRIWEQWKVIAPSDESPEFPLSAGARNFGKGFGWLWSLAFVTVLAFTLVVFALSYLCHCCHC